MYLMYFLQKVAVIYITQYLIKNMFMYNLILYQTQYTMTNRTQELIYKTGNHYKIQIVRKEIVHM